VHLPSKRGIEYFQLSMFPTNRGICFSFKLTRMNRLRVGFWRSYSIAIPRTSRERLPIAWLRSLARYSRHRF
jgi:hypothetical protein